MFRCAASWVTLSAFPPAEFAQTELLQTTFRTLVSNNQQAVLLVIIIPYYLSDCHVHIFLDNLS